MWTERWESHLWLPFAFLLYHMGRQMVGRHKAWRPWQASKEYWHAMGGHAIAPIALCVLLLLICIFALNFMSRLFAMVVLSFDSSCFDLFVPLVQCVLYALIVLIALFVLLVLWEAMGILGATNGESQGRKVKGGR